MNRTLTLAVALLFAIALCASAQDDPNRPPRSGSLTQDFKNEAKQAGTEIKDGAKNTANSVKGKTSKANKKAAVAQCDDAFTATRRKTPAASMEASKFVTRSDV